jgi:membrane protein
MMILKLAGNYLKLFFDSYAILKRNDPLRLAAATAFFTTFALPPILIILLQLFGLFVNAEQLGKKFFHTLAVTFGKEGALQIRTVFRGIKALGINPYVTIGGFIFLMFVATTLFKIIKDSINQLWGIKLNRSGIKVQMKSRLKSMAVIVVAGVLFISSILADGLQSVIGTYMQGDTESSIAIIILLVNKSISLGIVTIWFTLVFRYLPDGQPNWRVAFTGGLFTAILFTIGKFLLRGLLPYKNINSVFGASGSFVLLLLFVFYSSFTLYYGACFTKMFGMKIKEPIQPRSNAFTYELVEQKTEDETA